MMNLMDTKIDRFCSASFYYGGLFGLTFFSFQKQEFIVLCSTIMIIVTMKCCTITIAKRLNR